MVAWWYYAELAMSTISSVFYLSGGDAFQDGRFSPLRVSVLKNASPCNEFRTFPPIDSRKGMHSLTGGSSYDSCWIPGGLNLFDNASGGLARSLALV